MWDEFIYGVFIGMAIHMWRGYSCVGVFKYDAIYVWRG